jgi:hypothetical protein
MMVHAFFISTPDAGEINSTFRFFLVSVKEKSITSCLNMILVDLRVGPDAVMENFRPCENSNSFSADKHRCFSKM